MDPQLYQAFNQRREEAREYWHTNFVTRYGSAYTDARSSFLKTVEDQRQADEKAAAKVAATTSALTMLALSLTGGSILTVVFGAAAAKVAAGKIATDVICKYEMNRVFKVAHFVNTNKTANFIAGEIADKTSGYLSDKSGEYLSERFKQSLEETGEQFPQLAEFAAEPLKIQNQLDGWVGKAHIKVMEAADEIDARIKDEARNRAAILTLMKAPFFRSAPVKEMNIAFAKLEIELTFWMKYVLDLDYLALDAHGTRAQIGESPSSQSHPSNIFESRRKRLGGSRDVGLGRELPQYKLPPRYEHVAMGYQQIGSIIRKQIDELSKARFKRPFFKSGEKISLDTLKRAESTLTLLGHDNAAVIQRNLWGYHTGTVSGY